MSQGDRGPVRHVPVLAVHPRDRLHREVARGVPRRPVRRRRPGRSAGPFEALRTVAAERRAAINAERAAAKEQALKDRTAIVERAEAIAAQDPDRTQWKSSGAESHTTPEYHHKQTNQKQNFSIHHQF